MQLFTILHPKVLINSGLEIYDYYGTSQVLQDYLPKLDSSPTILEQSSNDKEFVLKMFVPRIKASDIDISADPKNDNISICLNRQGKDSLCYTLRFMQDYDAELATSSLREEVLTLRVPFKEKVKPKKIPVQ